MKTTLKNKIVLILLVGAVASVTHAGENTTNRLTVSARVGFNINASFDYSASAGGGASPKTTPDGDPYNYDDGYVLTDISGNAGGQTWYWGYDDSAVQDTGSQILMSRSSAVGASSGANDMDGSTPFIGAEIVFSQELEVEDTRRFGFDYTISFLPLEFKDNSSFSTAVSTTTDAFDYTTGTTPPTATSGTPYQGTFNGPGFLISATPASSIVSVVPGGVVNVQSELDGILWGARIGPYLEYPLTDSLALHISGGISLGILDVDVNWQATGAVTEQGGGHDTELLSGAYLLSELSWRISENWRAAASAQFEYLNDWQGNFGAGTVSLDLTRSLYATLGIAWDF